MTRIRTFIDSGVLIAAARGNDEVARRAMEILDDPCREFIASDFVRLEVLPKAIYHGQEHEADFYRTFFGHAGQMVHASEALVSLAFERATRYGLRAVDALHVAAAQQAEAHELVTSEQTTKPFFRVAELTVTSVRPPT